VANRLLDQKLDANSIRAIELIGDYQLRIAVSYSECSLYGFRADF